MQGRLGILGTTQCSFWMQWVSYEGRTLEETTEQSWMLREVGVSMNCAVSVGKGKSLRVAYVKCVVPESCMRISS